MCVYLTLKSNLEEREEKLEGTKKIGGGVFLLAYLHAILVWMIVWNTLLCTAGIYIYMFLLMSIFLFNVKELESEEKNAVMFLHFPSILKHWVNDFITHNFEQLIHDTTSTKYRAVYRFLNPTPHPPPPAPPAGYYFYLFFLSSFHTSK